MNEKELLEIIERAAEEKATELDLSVRGIKSLPAEIVKLTNLTYLRLSNNQLTSVPAELGQLTKLTILDFSYNQLTSIPAELGKLTNLTELWLHGNRLTSIPAELGKLTKLTTLFLPYNQLTSIPAELGKLTKLTDLDLSGNQLTSIPAELGKLTNLTGLDLHSNQLTGIPAELGKLTNLTGLDLSDNQLTSIPAELGKLTNLKKYLDLSDNQLTSIPAELGKLTNLTLIYLHNNQLMSVPAELGQLTNLTELSLFSNQLTSIPAELGKLKNLTTLYLYDNKLTSIQDELGKLTNLMLLDLSGNKLTSIPAELGELTKLKRLNLSINKLTNIPAELGKLTNLMELELSGNQLTSIPADLGKLAKLTTLSLDGNKALTSPPPDIVKQGTKAILAYLRELGKGKKKRYEAKLLILGDADEGKTCVSRALRDEPFEHQDTTEGVDIEQWSFAHPDYTKDRRKKIRLNIWDFEGQEINHQSHQFFLTQRAFYLLVFKGREVFNRARVEYWLDTIRSRAPESEVVLVATECEKRTPRVPIEELIARYPDLLKYKRCFFTVGCSTNTGVKTLQRHLQKRAAKLEVMGTNWPKTYAKAENAIKELAQKRAHISRRRLHGIFKRNGITKADYEDAANLMGYLGIITHFPTSEDLKNFVILKPQWLTKAISFALENPQLEKDQGEITHKHLHSLWEKEYKGLSQTLHKCMKEFELCYDLEYRKRQLSLVPLRFGFEEPRRIPWRKTQNAKERRIEYRFDVTPPAGIMSRFIVKTHYMIVKSKQMPKGVYWYNGVFLATDEGDNRSEALCEFDEDKRVMSIRVRAAFPQNMIEQLNGFAQSIFSFFEGLKPERYYGCVNITDGKESQCDGIYTEKRISFALTQRSKLGCEYGYHKIDPLYLVTGITSFGNWDGLEDKLRAMLRQEMDREPTWAEKFGKNVRSILVRVDRIVLDAEKIREQGDKLPAVIEQKFRLAWRDYWDMLDSLLDNREFNAAPGIVSVVPDDGSLFNPKDWFTKEYILTPYCEYKGGAHKADFCHKFKKSRKWWEKTAPKVAIGVKVLSAGIKIACAGLPLAVDPKLFEAMKNEVEFMKELAGHLELEGGAELDISVEAAETVNRIEQKGRVRDFRQSSGDDEKRIVRMQLAELFQQIAPANYKARQWGELRRVRMPDNTYRWLCARHAAEYRI